MEVRRPLVLYYILSPYLLAHKVAIPDPKLSFLFIAFTLLYISYLLHCSSRCSILLRLLTLVVLLHYNANIMH